jgi:hypothetical protein
MENAHDIGSHPVKAAVIENGRLRLARTGVRDYILSRITDELSILTRK